MRCIYIPLRQGYVDIDTLDFYDFDLEDLGKMENSDIEFLNVEFGNKPCKEVSQSNDIVPLTTGNITVYTYCLGYYSFENYEYESKDLYIRVLSNVLYVWYRGYIVSFKVYDGFSSRISKRFSRPYFNFIYKEEDGTIVIDNLLEHFKIGIGSAVSDTLNGIKEHRKLQECPDFSKLALKRYVLLQ